MPPKIDPSRVRITRLGDQFTCSVCFMLLREPVQARECKHVFCRCCIEAWHECSNGDSCPLCRRKNVVIEPVSQYMTQIFLSLLVKCSKAPSKEHYVPLRDLEEHELTCDGQADELIVRKRGRSATFRQKSSTPKSKKK